MELAPLLVADLPPTGPPKKRQKTESQAIVEDTSSLQQLPRVRKPQENLNLHTIFSDPADIKVYQRKLDTLLKIFKKKKKIVVVAGAGISVGAGIPDFRSPTGLFASLRTEHKLKTSGKELFDAAVYRSKESTSSFHDMVRSLDSLAKKSTPTIFHHLLATLATEGRLLRLYSQNVDCIENQLLPLKTIVPLSTKGPWPKTIQLHGGLEKMVCQKCGWLGEFEASLFKGSEPPDCRECLEMECVRGIAGKRSLGVGKLRPRIVLYNEYNPDSEAIGMVCKADLKARPDAVIVVGTSLKVPGIRRIVREMCKSVQDIRGGVTVWLNEEDAPLGKDLEGSFDLIVKGDCEKVARLASLPRWDGSESESSSTTGSCTPECGEASAIPEGFSAIPETAPTITKSAAAHAQISQAQPLPIVKGSHTKRKPHKETTQKKPRAPKKAKTVAPINSMIKVFKASKQSTPTSSPIVKKPLKRGGSRLRIELPNTALAPPTPPSTDPTSPSSSQEA